FQGMGEPGLKLMREAADKFGLFTISEVMDASQISMMLGYVDIFQVGARNMQNYYLLRALGEIRKPVLLKRGMSATMEELLMSAEYILAGGNYNVILCERGIRRGKRCNSRRQECTRRSSKVLHCGGHAA